MTFPKDESPNTEKLVIEFSDLGHAYDLSDSDRSLASGTHPFHEPGFRAYLDATFPDFVESVDTATRPSISDKPDELEHWESERILARKSRRSYESAEMYLRRLLYEETFSVNQNPGSLQSFRGSYGMTPGGLISHYYWGG